MQTRKRVVVGTAAFCLAAALSLTSYAAGTGGTAKSNTAPIPVTLIVDETGPLGFYGLPMQAASKLAIADINATGGVLGRKLKLTDLDSQSSQAKYVVLARQAASSDTAVVVGGILSASREAIRPVLDRAKKLYFYTPLYEGGVCDKNTFTTGAVPTQQLAPMLKWAAGKGLKKWYVMAANYNYGQISAKWVQHFAKLYGATLVGGSPKFYALSDSNFSSVIPNIQASGADLIVSLLVGAAHDNFYKQWAATGLNKTTTIVSPVFGYGADQITLGKAGTGINAVWQYMPTAHPDPDNKFAAAWKASGTKQPLTPGAVTIWNAWHLWAAAANKAGSVNRDKVIAALETGDISFKGPGGPVYMDGPTHQAVMPMKLYRDNGHGSFDLVKVLSKRAEPTFIQSKCNLIKHPNVNKQFVPQLSQ